MIGLDRLMDRRGVVAAGQFSPDGKVVRAVGSLSKDQMEAVARSCANLEKQAWIAATELRDTTKLDWGNLNGWVLWSGKLALCVSGDTGVFVEAGKADFNQLMVDLYGPPSGEHPRILVSPPEPPRTDIPTHPPATEELGMEYEDYDLATTDTHKPARPMMFFKDKEGNGWLCDKGIDPDGDLEAQGCWRCEDMAFPMGI
jgi:roadblock/LC7 domain-containing protein